MLKTKHRRMGDCLKSKIENLIDLNSEAQKEIRQDLDNHKKGMRMTEGDLLDLRRFINENLDRLNDIYQEFEN